MYTSNKTLLQILVEELPKRGGWPEGTSRISQGAVTRCIYADGHRVLFRHNVYGGDDCVTRDQYEAALAASQAPAADADGWIEWHGGECPLEKGTIIDTKDRDGHENFGEVIGRTNNVDDIFWQRGVCSYPALEIIAYRLHQPHEVKTAGIDVQRDAVKSNDAQLEADMDECISRDEILYELANFAATTKTSLDIGVATEIAIWLSGKGYRKQ